MLLGAVVILMAAFGFLIGFFIYFRRNRAHDTRRVSLFSWDNLEKLLDQFLWPIIALAATFLAGAYFNGIELNVFFVIEMIVLCTFAGLSTYNYKSLKRRLTGAGVTSDRELRMKVFTLLNIGGFAFAAATLKSAPLHVASVTLIFIFFSLANIRQVTVLLGLPSSNRTKKRYIATVEGHTWLSEENGLSALAFMVISFAILLIAIFDSDSSQRAEKYFFEPLKAFATGATTFHLALSVIKYGKIVQQEDITEAVLQRVRWSQDAANRLHSGSNDVCNRWQKIIIGVSIITFILATASYLFTK